MSNFKCPHCGVECITKSQKFRLGPAVPMSCEACGKKVGVPYISILSVVPFIAPMAFYGLFDNLALFIVALSSGFVAMTYVHIRFVPLVKR